MVAETADDDIRGALPRRMASRPLTMSRIDPILATPLEHRMAGNQPAFVQDADAVGKLVNLDKAPGAIGNAIVVAADRDETIMADATLQLEKRVEGNGRERLKFRLLRREGFTDDALRGAMQASIGDGVEPILQLLVQVVEIAEAAGQEEVLADIAEWSLDFALGFGAIRPAGSGLEAKVLGQRQQRTIVDDVAFVIFAGNRRLHPVVEDLDRHSSNGVESLHMTAQQRLQVLVH